HSVVVRLEQEDRIRDLGGFGERDLGARLGRRPGACRTLVVEARILGAADGVIARGSAVVAEDADADDAVGAEAVDCVFFRPDARAGGWNLFRGGASGGARLR